MAQDLIDMLVDAGFERVSVVEKEESKEFIKDWLPGSGAEDYVVSANVTAYKACTSGDGALSDADLYEDDAKSSLKAVAADAFAAPPASNDRRRLRSVKLSPRSSPRWAPWFEPSVRTTRSTPTFRERSTAARTWTARRMTCRRR